MAKRKDKGLGVHDPLLFPDHARPVTRRDFLRQGLMSGSAVVTGGAFWSLFASPRQAMADLSTDIRDMATSAGCPVGGSLTGMVPFICFDLAGGANFAASNVLAGITDGFGTSMELEAQLENMTASGFSKLGVPNTMIPGTAEVDTPLAPGSNGDYTNNRLGLYFHSDSALLAGILDKFTSIDGPGGIDGCIVPARSENDTGNNPHNPMYGIARTGADGSITTLIGSRSSDSGGNSLAPMNLIDPTIRPTKIDRPSDVEGLIDTGKLVGLLSRDDAVAVLESVARLSDAKLGRVSTGLAPTADEVIKDLVRCGYIGAADIAERFGGLSISPDDRLDPLGQIVGDGRIFTEAEFDSDGEFRKTASVMKMVVDGFAGAGTVTMGGYDYHVGDRETGERRDRRAGRCIGACLEYAARRRVPLMVYVFSDGSVFSNGRLDMSADGRGKGEWTGDNQQGASSFFLVYDPNGPIPITRRQIGWFRPSGDVETAATPVANNVNSLVDLVVLNYLALHGRQGELETLIPTTALRGTALKDRLTAFGQIQT
jgi:hypothetical protein